MSAIWLKHLERDTYAQSYFVSLCSLLVILILENEQYETIKIEITMSLKESN